MINQQKQVKVSQNKILSEKILNSLNEMNHELLNYHINMQELFAVALMPDEPSPKQKEWLIVAKKRLLNFAL